MLLHAVSRLGDGVFWYVLMLLLLAADRTAAIAPVLHMVAAGGRHDSVPLVEGQDRAAKAYQLNQAISCNARRLDQYSLPSGHTLHAIAFTTIAIAYCPQLAFLLIPFACMVALSRVVLGLHYPSDVLAGAAIGAPIAGFSLVL